MAQLDETLVDVQNKVSETSQELERFSSDPDQLIESLREDFVALMQEEARLSNRLTVLHSDMEKASQTKELQAQEERDLKEKLDRLSTEFDDIKADYQEKQETVAQLLTDYQTLASSIKVQEQTYQQEQSRLFDILDQKKQKKPAKQV